MVLNKVREQAACPPLPIILAVLIPSEFVANRFSIMLSCHGLLDFCDVYHLESPGSASWPNPLQGATREVIENEMLHQGEVYVRNNLCRALLPFAIPDDEVYLDFYAHNEHIAKRYCGGDKRNIKKYAPPIRILENNGVETIRSIIEDTDQDDEETVVRASSRL